MFEAKVKTAGFEASDCYVVCLWL